MANYYCGLWRGKRLDNDKWIIGYLLRKQGALGMTVSYIMAAEKSEFDFNDDYVAVGDEWIPVETKTLGQCVGFSDKNKKFLFDGDVCKHEQFSALCVVIWNDELARFELKSSGITDIFDNYFAECSEVVGNIYDNPELLKGADVGG